MNKSVLHTAAFRTSIALLALATSLPGLTEDALAENALADDAVETITIIGTRAESIATLPAVIEVITERDIERSGAQTLADILATQVGLQIVDSIGNGGRGVSISMRGFGENNSNNVLVLVDGRRLNNPTLAGPDLSSIAINDITRIEILQGSAGSLYGDQASAGVINIVTKSAQRDSAQVEIGLGSFATKIARGNFSRQLDDNLSLRVNAESSSSDNYRDNNDNEHHNINARLQWRLGDVNLGFEMQGVNDRLRFPGSLNAADYRDHPRRSNTPNDFGNTETIVERINGDWSLANNWTLYWDISHRDQDGEGELFATNYQTETDVRDLQPRVVARLPIDDEVATITMGIDSEKAEHLADYGFGVTNVAQKVNDAYAQALWPLSKATELTLATRHSWFDFSPRIGVQDYRDDVGVYQYGVAHTIDQLRVFARYDRGFRWPNVDENGFVEQGVEHLNVQRSNTKELGYEWTASSWQFSASAFDVAMDDEIVYDPMATGPFGPFSGANVNRDFTKRRGVNLSSAWSFSDSLKWTVAYSQINATFDGGAFDGHKVPFVAERLLKSHITYVLSDQWQAYVDAAYTGPRYRAGDQLNAAGELGGYTVFNFSLRWQLDSLYAQLRVNNLTDKSYSSYSGVGWSGDYYYPAAMRNMMLLFGYQF